MKRHFSIDAFREELKTLEPRHLVSKLFYSKFNLATILQIEREGEYSQERIKERRAHWTAWMQAVEEEIEGRGMDLEKAQAWAPQPIVPTDKDVVVKMKPIYLTGEFKG